MLQVAGLAPACHLMCRPPTRELTGRNTPGTHDYSAQYMWLLVMRLFKRQLVLFLSLLPGRSQTKGHFRLP